MRIALVLLLAACTQAEPEPEPVDEAEPEPQLELVPRAQITSARASSELSDPRETFGAAQALDGKTDTAWCEGEKGLGLGTTLTLTLREATDLARIEVDAGFFKDDRTMINNGRPRAITIASDQGWSKVMRFQFVPHREHKLPEITVPPGRLDAPGAAGTLTFTLDEADEGRATQDVCISRIALYTQ